MADNSAQVKVRTGNISLGDIPDDINVDPFQGQISLYVLHNFFGLHLQKGIGHLHNLLLGLVLLLVAVQLSLEVLPVVLLMRSYRTK